MYRPPQNPPEPDASPGRKSEPAKPATGPVDRDKGDPLIDIVLARVPASTLAARLGMHVGPINGLLNRLCVYQWGRRVLRLDSQRHWVLLDLQLRRELAEQEAGQD